MVRATRRSCEPGVPVTRSTSSGRPLGNLFLDLVHAPDAGADELLVLPPVLEDVPEDAPDQRHVRARAEPDVLVGMGRGAREARVADDQRRVVLFLGLQHVQEAETGCASAGLPPMMKIALELWMSLYELVMAP